MYKNSLKELHLSQCFLLVVARRNFSLICNTLPTFKGQTIHIVSVQITCNNKESSQFGAQKTWIQIQALSLIFHICPRT